MSATGTATATTETATTTTTTANDNWFAALPDEAKGYIVNRGLDKGTPTEAFLNAHAAHRNAEKAIGAPSDRVLIRPADAADQAGWDAFHTKNGRPTEAKGYEFPAEDDADKKLAEFLRGESFRLGIPKSAAEDLWTKWTEFGTKQKTDDIANTAAQLALDAANLKKSWGPNEPVNLVIAARAAAALGISQEQFDSARTRPGYAQTYEMFLKIGQKIGEDKFVSGTNVPAGGAYTREQAISRKAELLNDRAWGVRYSGGGITEKNEMTALNKIIAGDSPQQEWR